MTTCHLQEGFKENVITASDIKALKTTSDNVDYSAQSKKELKETGKGVNLKAGETQLVVQLDESKPVPLSSVTLFVPKDQRNKLEKVEVLVKESSDKAKKPKLVASLRGKEIAKKLPNLLEGIPEISATEIELRLTKRASGNANIKLEIKACFHPKTTTTPHTTITPPVFNSK